MADRTENQMIRRIRWKLHRLRCVLTGCIQAEDYPACHRCDAPVYGDPDDAGAFIDFGKLDWFFHLRRQVRSKLARNKCEQCGRKFYFGYNDHLCSEECHDEWLPF